VRGPVTAEEIEAAKTPAGGWTRATLAQWGVPWPPPKGWRAKLEGRAAQADTRPKDGDNLAPLASGPVLRSRMRPEIIV
jgi:hypothetical protein